MCNVFEIQICRELRQKILEAILKSSLRQQCINKSFAEDFILNPDNPDNRPLPRYFFEINRCIDKKQAIFLLPVLVFNYSYSPPGDLNNSRMFCIMHETCDKRHYRQSSENVL